MPKVSSRYLRGVIPIFGCVESLALICPAALKRYVPFAWQICSLSKHEWCDVRRTCKIVRWQIASCAMRQKLKTNCLQSFTKVIYSRFVRSERKLRFWMNSQVFQIGTRQHDKKILLPTEIRHTRNSNVFLCGPLCNTRKCEQGIMCSEFSPFSPDQHRCGQDTGRSECTGCSCRKSLVGITLVDCVQKLGKQQTWNPVVTLWKGKGRIPQCRKLGRSPQNRLKVFWAFSSFSP